MMKIQTYPIAIAFNLLFSGYCIAAESQVPETVTLEAGSFDYRASGEYLKEGYPIDAPMQNIVFDSPLTIMKYQVRVGSYEQCVAETVCKKRYNHGRHAVDLPVTGVSYRDAIVYAKWLGKKTGMQWRLPTDEEWAYAAGSRFIDDAVNVSASKKNPSIRWLAKYKNYADLETGSDPVVKPLGSYGANENGIYDMSGNVWEWTDSCYKRTRLDASGTQTSATDNCGVRISAGQHRAYITSFIQNAKGGGCSVGAAPDYLGFRLVKEPKQNVIRRVLDVIGL